MPLPARGGSGNQGQEHTVPGVTGVGGEVGGGNEERSLKESFLSWLLLFNFLTMAVGDFKLFLILRTYTSQAQLAGIPVIQAEECQRKGRMPGKNDTLTSALRAALGQPPASPQSSLGALDLCTAEEPGHKGPSPPAADSVPLVTSSRLTSRVAQGPPHSAPGIAFPLLSHLPVLSG